MRLLEEVDEGVVVGVHIHMGVVEVAPPHGECMHNGKHLSIMDRVVDLGRGELARLKGNGLEALALVLHEDGADSKVGGVGVKAIGEGWVGDDESRSGGEGGLELVHHLLMLVRPCKLHSFLEEIGEGCTYLGMVLVEASVVVGQAKEAP
jgi:hypothetical protein